MTYLLMKCSKSLILISTMYKKVNSTSFQSTLRKENIQEEAHSFFAVVLFGSFLPLPVSWDRPALPSTQREERVKNKGIEPHWVGEGGWAGGVPDNKKGGPLHLIPSLYTVEGLHTRSDLVHSSCDLLLTAM